MELLFEGGDLGGEVFDCAVVGVVLFNCCFC